jgi:uncharacterized membrane protein
MEPGPPEPENLRQEIIDLKQRVARLETALGQGGAQAATTSANVEPTQQKRAESLESRIGSRLFNRIGIIAVLIGVAWFLKIAFDNRWLGSVGKVSAGVAAGLALIAWSERFHKRGYDAFSYSLKAVGAGLLYLSLWAAWSLFHLLSLPAAGFAMILVTGCIGLLAWARNSELLAFYSAVGGYLTPLLLSNGQNHETALFSYLLLLDGAALALVAARRWPRLALSAFVASVLYGIGWAAFYYTEAQFGLTLGFAIAFLLLFAVLPFIADTDPGRGQWILLTVPILNAMFAFAGTIFLFGPDGRAWASFALCGFYFALVRPRRPAAVHVLIANSFLLAAVAFGIHRFWIHPSQALGSVDEEISYSAWLMLFGAITLGAGFWRRSAALRWQGLIVLCVSIAKVFLVDMQTLSQGYRVLSFLGLGALLLAVSFVYQKDWLSLRGDQEPSRGQRSV